jgi:pyruvate dehydrogenase E1 component beta subunit
MTKMTYAQAVIEAQRYELRRDKDVLIIGEDIAQLGGCFGLTAGLYDEFGSERVINTPICESGLTGMGVGLALLGKRPIVELMFADFAAYAYDSIANQAVKIRFETGGRWTMPLTIRAPQGAYTSAGATHSQCVEGWFQNIPALKIVVPSTPADVYGLLKTAVRDDDTVLFLEHKALLGLKGEVPDKEDFTIPLGKARVVREGKDVTIVAYQMMLRFAQVAAEQLAQEGIEAEIIDPRTIFPFDKVCLATSVEKTGRVLFVHESPLRGGVGGEMAAFVAEECFGDLKAPVKRLGGADTFSVYNEQEAYAFPDDKQIVAMVKEIMG